MTELLVQHKCKGSDFDYHHRASTEPITEQGRREGVLGRRWSRREEGRSGGVGGAEVGGAKVGGGGVGGVEVGGGGSSASPVLPRASLAL